MRIHFTYNTPARSFPDGSRFYECVLPTPPRVGDYVSFNPDGSTSDKVAVVSWVVPGSHPQPGFQPAIPTRGPIRPDVYVVLQG